MTEEQVPRSKVADIGGGALNDPRTDKVIGVTNNRGILPMDWEAHITRCPEICSGKPCFVGTRISVDLILEHLSNGWSDQDLIEHFGLTQTQVRAAQAFAASS